MDKFGLSQRTIDELLNYFKSKQEIQKVLIFGSRAKGNFRRGSDIDFAVIVNNIPVSHIAWDLGELPTPYKFDVVNYDSIDNPKFKDSIDTFGKIFYEK